MQETTIYVSRLCLQILIALLTPLAGSAAFAADVIRIEPRYAKEAKEILASVNYRGGLIVHLGCGDGRLTAALHTGGDSIVRGLDADAAQVAKAREHIHSLGLYGRVSADTFDGKHLPYADNLVNLVVASAECQVARGASGIVGIKQRVGKW